MWEFLPSWGHPHPSPQFEIFFPIFPFIVGMIDWRIFVCVIMILDPRASVGFSKHSVFVFFMA